MASSPLRVEIPIRDTGAADEPQALAGRAVVVTGAGRGLGRAYARHAAQSGAAVVVNDIDAASATAIADEIRQLGGRAVADTSDVSDWDGSAAMIDACVHHFGRIDGLVNNAGITPGRKGSWAAAPETIARVLRVNVLGGWYCTLHAVRHMSARGAGSIVNITSGQQSGKPPVLREPWASDVPWIVPVGGVYATTKGAVASMTYSLALDLQRYGLRINAVSPLATTPMSTGAVEGIPPENVAPVVTYLLSELSQHITGQVVRVNGRDLNLMTHPDLAPHYAVATAWWTLDGVRMAFDTFLNDHLQPVGLGAEQYVPPAAATPSKG